MILDAADEKMIDDVRSFGWHCVNVPKDEIGPGFAFSVGFWETLAAPEVIIFGLRSEVMHHMLYEVFRQMKAGKKMGDGEHWRDLIEGFECISRPVHQSHIRDYFGAALWYQRYRASTDGLTACQIFWPGKVQGLFPWEQGCDEAVRSSQPSLYLPRETGSA